VRLLDSAEGRAYPACSMSDPTLILRSWWREGTR
jgi:hypothetical protein